MNICHRLSRVIHLRTMPDSLFVLQYYVEIIYWKISVCVGDPFCPTVRFKPALLGKWIYIRDRYMCTNIGIVYNRLYALYSDGTRPVSCVHLRGDT